MAGRLQRPPGYNGRMAAASSSNSSRSALDAFKPLAGRALEIALNRIVGLDPETQLALQALDGRRVQVVLEAPTLALQLSVHDGRFEVGPVPRQSGDHGIPDEPDLAVRSTLGGLLSQLPFFRASTSSPVGKLRIAGDADLARRLQKLAEGFDPDWAKPFADVFGDVIGVQIANALRGALRFGRDTAEKFARNGVEYVTEESRDVIGSDELDAFHDDVDALRDRVERVAAKAAALDRRTPAAPGNAKKPSE